MSATDKIQTISTKSYLKKKRFRLTRPTPRVDKLAHKSFFKRKIKFRSNKNHIET